ncbi:MAG: beta-N-acetylhexosaminidase [Verrucomicrobiaceae bacterium]|nr:MAG: beta-N-acetylhexosaminidase [Verrucomicrobiaceae bacterium]
MIPIPAILPRPAVLQPTDAQFLLDAKTAIVAPKPLDRIGRMLQGYLKGTEFPLPLQSRSRKGAIRLKIDKSRQDLGDEGYTLDVSADAIEICAAKPAGVFYGVQTLRQLLPASLYGGRSAGPLTVPGVHVEDRPRFVWRGAHLDVCRHFMPKEFLFRYVDLLALHKLNTFHLHLTDDQGWRIEIKRYPKLTSVGGWRKETMAGHYREQKWDGTPHGGYYTQEDLKQLVAYAKDRFVNIVPEIEMPGHAQAAIAAYPELGNLSTPLEVGTRWGVIENIANVEDSTIKFFQNVLDETMKIFPSKFIHVGGDEAPKKQWQESPRVQARIKDLGLKDEHEMQSWFIRQMDAHLAKKGRRLIGWDEILEGGLAPGATVMSWRGEEGGIAAAKSGHDVVMAPNPFTYFDFYQGDPKTEPLAIGGRLPLSKAYSFEPIPAVLTAEEAKHVLGAQGQLWTEYIDSPAKLEYMAFPRLSALSEVLWSPKEGKSYDEFLVRLRPHLERLRSLGVNFREPEELRGR